MKGVNTFEHKIFVDVYYRTRLPHVSFFVFFLFFGRPPQAKSERGKGSIYVLYIHLLNCYVSQDLFFLARSGVAILRFRAQRWNQTFL